MSLFSSASSQALDPVENWTLRLSSTNTLTRVQAAGDRVFALGPGHLYDSTNGQDWTLQPVTNPAAYAQWPLNGVAFGHGKYVLVGNHRLLVSASATPEEWTPAVYPDETPDLYDVRFLDDHFLAVGGSIGFGAKILTSPDGLTWTEQPTGVQTELRGIAAGAGRVVVVGGARPLGGVAGGMILSSTNGATWQIHEIPSLTGERFLLNAVAFHDGAFVATGFDARFRPLVAISLNGTNWSAADTFLSTAGLDVTAGAGHFINVGSVEASTSPNGSHPWYRHPTPGVRSIAYFAETFLGLQIAEGSTRYNVWQTSRLSPRIAEVAWDPGSPRTLRLQMDAIAGSSLQVETSLDLSHWAPAITVPLTNAPPAVLVEAPPDQEHGFWRVRSP